MDRMPSKVDFCAIDEGSLSRLYRLAAKKLKIAEFMMLGVQGKGCGPCDVKSLLRELQFKRIQ